MSNKRYGVLDGIRGIILISMIAYHTVWDLVNIFDVRWSWFRSDPGYLWQQSICWSFILLSGFCWSMGRRQLRRGCMVFCAGALVSVVTLIVMPENVVIFGVLTFLGTAMLLLVPVYKYVQKWNPFLGVGAAFALFMIFRSINDGYLGVGSIRLVKLPGSWYANMFTTFLGLPERGFHSTDYFSVLPWLFLFVTGYFLYNIAASRNLLRHLENQKLSGPWWLRWLGRHSLIIYMLHQPVIYGVLYVGNRLAK